MSMFPKKYCKKHGIDYHGYMCPECIQELREKASQSNSEKSSKKPEKFTLLFCPNCNEQSLFFDEDTNEYECVNLKCRIKGKSIDDINAQIEVLQNELSFSVYSPENEEVKITDEKDKQIETDIESKLESVQDTPRESTDKKSSFEQVASIHEPEPTPKKNTRYEYKNNNPKPPSNQNKPIRYPAWLLVLVLVFASSLIGFAVSYFTGTFILFWLLFGGSIIYSIEHWYYQQTRRYRTIGKVYRTLINLSVFSLLVLVIWSGFHLFNQSFHSNLIIGVIIFIIEIVALLWLFKVINRNKWRWPSLKLTFFTILVLVTILAFAGIQPFQQYKDNTLSKVSSFFEQTTDDSSAETITQETLNDNEVLTQTVDPISDSQETNSNELLDNISSIFTPSSIETDNLVPGSSFVDDRSIFSSIDQHALNAPESVAQSIDALAEYLIQPATNDLEKARVIYRWITKNISYDFSAYLLEPMGAPHQMMY